MFCRKCGEEIPDDSLFCPKCGAKLSETSVQTEPNPAPKPVSDPRIKRIEDLQRSITAAMKKMEYGILDENRRTALEKECTELKRYDKNSFIANDCLVHLRCQELGFEKYSERFDAVVDLIKTALSSCPPEKRQYYAEEQYYYALLGAAQKLLQQCKNEYYNLPPNDMFGLHPRKAYLNKYAERDFEIYRSLVKVLRIPYLSDDFLDTVFETLCLRYSDYDEHQRFVMVRHFTSGGKELQFSDMYSEELKSNYPEYVRRLG